MTDLTGLILYELSLIWFPLCFLGIFASAEYVQVYEILTYSTFPMNLRKFDLLCKWVGIFCLMIATMAWTGYLLHLF